MDSPLRDMDKELLEMLQYYLTEEPVRDPFVLGNLAESFEAGKVSGKNELRREIRKSLNAYLLGDKL